MSVQISVVVPVFEQWHLVPRLLDRLRAQRLPREQFEVILVADGRAPSVPLPTARIIDSPGEGAYAARNAGVTSGKGTWLVFTDADCLPQPDWLAALAERMEAVGEDTILAGRVAVLPGDRSSPTPCEVYDMIRGIPQHLYVERGYGATANLAVARSVFRRVGEFDAQRFSGGDAEFCRRARAAGMDIAYVAEAMVDHPARTNWTALATKAKRLKGGQLSAGSVQRRALWLLRTMTPPLRAISRFLASREFPPSQRWTAVGIQLRLWGVEVVEAARLLSGGRPERR